MAVALQCSGRADRAERWDGTRDRMGSRATLAGRSAVESGRRRGSHRKCVDELVQTPNEAGVKLILIIVAGGSNLDGADRVYNVVVVEQHHDRSGGGQKVAFCLRLKAIPEAQIDQHCINGVSV